jgi:hypothetical protein
MADEGKTAEQLAAEKESRDGQLRQADYTKKTQELAEQRKVLEKQVADWESTKRAESETLEVARNLKNAFDNDELVKAVVNGDKSKAKQLLGEIEDPDELKMVKKEIEELKGALRQKDAQEKNSQFNDFVKAEGRKLLKDEFGLTDEEISKEMETIRQKNNPYYTWARAAALEKVKERAMQEGIKKGTEDAIKEWHRKINNTRPISDGNGTTAKEGVDDTKQAAAMALEKIRRAASG